jgi:hypothetical protein
VWILSRPGEEIKEKLMRRAQILAGGGFSCPSGTLRLIPAPGIMSPPARYCDWKAVMFGDGSLTFREFVMREPLPLARIQEAVLEFLRGRDDAVLYGAQAVNAYVETARMTEDVDLLSIRAGALAEELREYLHETFRIAVRVRAVRGGIGYRVYQVRKPRNRHLVDVRQVDALPPYKRIDRIRVLVPAELIAAKVMSMVNRAKTVEGMLDRADIGRLLLAYPSLKKKQGPVNESLRRAGASERVLRAWNELVVQEILPPDTESGF